jgi:hypothetical protein
MARKSVFKWVKELALAAMAAASVGVAQAQQVSCADRSVLIEQLATKFQERQLAVGQMGPMVILEIFVADSGTWTIFATDVGGTSCVVAVGDNWQSMIVAGVGG